MKNHPGHFWICFWLLCITLNGCDVRDEAKKQTKALQGIEKAISSKQVSP